MASKKQKGHATSVSAQKSKRLICYVLAFILINLSFGYLVNHARAVDADDLITETISVDRIHSTRTGIRRGISTRFWLTANNVDFDIPISALHENNDTFVFFQEKVAEGDQLTISYFDITPFSQKLVIAEAYNDQCVFWTIEDYNASCIEPRVMAIILYFLATCVYSFVMITSEGWFMQWIRQRNIARKKNERALAEAAKATRRAEREALAAQTNKRASTAKHLKK